MAGSFLLRGELPLEMLLVFLGPVAAKSGLVRRPGLQMPDETSWVVKKFADEGSSSPFMARLLLSLFKLRDAALPEGDPRDRFDKAYQAVTAPLLDARVRVKNGALWEDHVRRVQAGEAARVRGHAIHVDENVDHELGQEADGFLNAAVRALKTGAILSLLLQSRLLFVGGARGPRGVRPAEDVGLDRSRQSGRPGWPSFVGSALE